MPQEMSSDGWRARIGVVVPSVNTVMEPWASRAAPEGVSVHFSRMYMPPETNADTLIEMDRSEGQLALRQLSSMKPSVIAYGCTASSIVQGVDYDEELRREITQPTASPQPRRPTQSRPQLQSSGANRFRLYRPTPPKLIRPSIATSRMRASTFSAVRFSEFRTGSSWPVRSPKPCSSLV